MMTSHPGHHVIRRLVVPYKHTQGQGNDEGHFQRITVLDPDNDSTEDSEEVIETSVSHVRDPCRASPQVARIRSMDRDMDRDRDRDTDRDGQRNMDRKHSRSRDDRDSHSYIRVSTYSRMPPRDRPDEASRRNSGHHPRHRHSADHARDNTRRQNPPQHIHGPHYRGHKSRHERRDRHDRQDRGKYERHERHSSRPDALPWQESVQDSSPLLDLASLLRRIGILDEDGDGNRDSRPSASTNTTARSSSSHARRHQTRERPRQSHWDGEGDRDDDDDNRHDRACRDDWHNSHRRYPDDHEDGHDGHDCQTRPRSRVRSRSFSSRRESCEFDRDHGNQDQCQDRHDRQDHQYTARDASTERQRQRQKTLFKAVKYAAKAGAVAAINSSSIPGDWLGDKGSRVATAAIGAALVDTFFNHNYPKRFNGLRHAAMRQVAERTIRSLTEPFFQRVAENRGRQRRRSC